MRQLTSDESQARWWAWMEYKQANQVRDLDNAIFTSGFKAALDYQQAEVDRLRADLDLLAYELSRCREDARLYHNTIVALQEGEVGDVL